MLEGGHLPIDRGGANPLPSPMSPILVQHVHCEGMNRRIAPHACEVGKVNALRRHTALMPYKVEIALSELVERQWLDERCREQAFLGFLPPINEALLRLSLVRG